MPERIIGLIQNNVPAVVGAGNALAASFIDINWGLVAGGITTVGLAVGAFYAQIKSASTKAYRENEAAKLEAYRQMEMAKIDLQRATNEANKSSLSEQIAELQASVNEANARLVEQKTLAAQQAEMLRQATQQNAYLSQQLSSAQAQLNQTQSQVNANTAALATVARKQDESHL